MVTPIESIIAIFMMSLGAFGGIWNGANDTHHSLSGKVSYQKKFAAVVMISDPLKFQDPSTFFFFFRKFYFIVKIVLHCGNNYFSVNIMSIVSFSFMVL